MEITTLIMLNVGINYRHHLIIFSTIIDGDRSIEILYITKYLTKMIPCLEFISSE